MAERSENILSNLGFDFVKELKKVVQMVLTQNGIKKDSALADSVEWDFGRDNLLMYVNDYYRSVSEGRKPLMKKIPIYALINFIKRNNIRSAKYSVGQLAFAMQNSIYKSGIQGKNFIEQVENAVTDKVEIQLADSLEELIADSLFAGFKIK